MTYFVTSFLEDVFVNLKGPKGFEPLTWWSEATRTIQAMQRVQTIKNLSGLNICLKYEKFQKKFQALSMLYEI